MKKQKITLIFWEKKISYFVFQGRVKINEDILSPTSQVGSFLLSRNIKNLKNNLKTLAYSQGNSGKDSKTYQHISIKKSEQKIKKSNLGSPRSIFKLTVKSLEEKLVTNKMHFVCLTSCLICKITK